MNQTRPRIVVTPWRPAYYCAIVIQTLARAFGLGEKGKRLSGRVALFRRRIEAISPPVIEE